MLDPNKARGELRDILNKNEYTIYNRPRGFLEIWWEKAKEWIAKQLEKLFPSLDSTTSLSGPILIAILVAVIIILAILTFFLFRNRVRNRMLRNQKPLQSRSEINWSFQKHLKEAEIREANEEFTDSTRHLFLALLLFFHEKEWLEARIWKTNWEYYAELKRVNQKCADEFYHLASFFDEVTYGEHTVQREDFLEFKRGAMKWIEEGGIDQLRERGKKV